MRLPVRPRKIFHTHCNFCDVAVQPGSLFSPDLAGYQPEYAAWAKSTAFSSHFQPWYFR
jgi:hypothetical protein